jgi:hypothetical protein
VDGPVGEARADAVGRHAGSKVSSEDPALSGTEGAALIGTGEQQVVGSRPRMPARTRIASLQVMTGRPQQRVPAPH